MSLLSHRTVTNGHDIAVFSPIVDAMVGTFKEWRDRQHQRRELAEMSDRDLQDAGLSRGELEFELDKPFWRK